MLTRGFAIRKAKVGGAEETRRISHPTDYRLVFGLLLILLLVTSAILAPLLAPFDPVKQNAEHMLAPPGWPFLLGTDEYGRDLFSRLLWGSRVSLLVSAGAVVISAGSGIPAGMLGGYYGGLVDMGFMRLTDLILVFPPILLAIAMVAFFGPSAVNLTLIIGVLSFPRFTRLAYATTLTTKSYLYVEASRAVGAHDLRIFARHILPNIMPTLLVQAPLALGFGILLESGLSFLGLGIQPPNPSWGLMVADARTVMTQSALNLIWPSLVITASVLAFNVVGDGLRDRFDPRLRRAGL
jgi:ABC-type dipeptide/oligopeptide/nickel transport system permease subunit